MPKKWGYIILALWIFSACTSPAENQMISETATATSTVTALPTSTTTATVQPFTRTPQPSKTPTVPPSATPTFDIASIVTRTPSPPEICPQPASVHLPDLSVDPTNYSFSFSPREEKILDYLSQGGNPSNLISLLRQTWAREKVFISHEIVQDLTGDTVPEILIIPAELFIFGCRDNKYELLMTKSSDAVSFNPITLQLVTIQDMNLNGVPEIVLADFGCGGMGAAQCLDVYIYEWDGNQFAPLVPKQEGYEVGLSMIGGRMIEYLPDASIRDIDQNGTLELILTGDIPNSWYSDYFFFAPWRDQSDTYVWNGEHFILLKTDFSAPAYRYQAVQDGDRAALRNEYDKALAFYQEAIFSDELLGWSPAHKERSIALHELAWNPDLEGTPTPGIPPDDPQEYPNLAAYARYRIMLLHIFQGNFPEAEIVYETLQEKFPEGSEGHGFALVAQAFWDQYQLSQNIKQSCAKAVSMAYKHKPILRFLGTDYHNSWQDIMYESKDVCPFE
jgi:tetratricopeptide (TPR) repeat protein